MNQRPNQRPNQHTKQSMGHTLARRSLLAGATAAAGAGIVTGGAGTALAGERGGAAARGRARGVVQGMVDGQAARLERELIALRRDLHRHPEAPGQEQRTATVVARELRAAGLSVTTGVGQHGVIGVLRGARPGRTVAYRADMDAVPPGGVVGGSTEPVHACGHDIHTTVGIGVAKVLARLRRHLSGTVVFVFQPAEESLSGARAVLEAGVLERTGVQEIHALHCGPFPVGRLAVTPGFGLPGQDSGKVTLSGPAAAEDARRLAAEIGALATVTPPATPAEIERHVAEVMTPDGPLARFVAVRATAQEAMVNVAYRCWEPERYQELRGEVRQLAKSYAGAQVSFADAPFPAMVCPEREGLALARHLREALGSRAVTRLHAAFPFNGEDFALFLERVPGTYTFLGVRAPGASVISGYPHYPDFTPDEGAIGVGVRAMAGWLAERARPGADG